MGTDIYLYYDGQPNDDSYMTKGYIRASIGMINENYILRQLFPPEVWEFSPDKCVHCKGEGFINYVQEKKYSWNEKHTKCLKCDGYGSVDGVKGMRWQYSQGGIEKLFRLGTQYMYAEQHGKNLGSVEEAGVAHGEKLTEMFGKMGMDVHNVAKEEKAESIIAHTTFCLDWLQSVFNHYKIGLELEKEGKHPRVTISW
jgi:hypothetical protein